MIKEYFLAKCKVRLQSSGTQFPSSLGPVVDRVCKSPLPVPSPLDTLILVLYTKL